jgi:GNAT superfamily N-acetyltransferase
LSWDGDPAHLPAGTHASMTQAVEQRAGSGFDTACAIQAVKHPGHRGHGLGQKVMRALFSTARSLGYERLVSPIRPTMKDAYPTIPLSRYVSWRRADGLPLDAWLRTSQRVGGRLLHVCDDSLVMEGTVQEWEAWTGLALPETGEYVIPGGQELLRVDREADRGRYSESHVWFDFT